MKITHREQEIIQLVAEELTTKEIAAQLYISNHTVVSHRKNLMEKLQVKNAAGLVRKGFESGLLRLAMMLIFSICIQMSSYAQDVSVGLQVDTAHDVVFGTPLGEEEGAQFHWSPNKSALRAGFYHDAYWTENSIGNCSIALGCENSAQGQYGMTWGNFTHANAMSSTVWGQYNVAPEEATLSTMWGLRNEVDPTAIKSTVFGEANRVDNILSAAWGIDNRAGGYGSTVMGQGNVAKGYAALVAGTYCDTINGQADQSILSDLTPLFVIGNGRGVGDTPRSNALSVYGSGMMKIGSGTAGSDLHIKQSETGPDGGTGGLRLEHGSNNDYWQVYHSGLYLSFGKAGERKAYITDNGQFVDASNFRQDDQKITKSLSSSTDKILNVKIGSNSYSKKKKEVKIDVAQLLNDFPEMVVHDERGDPFGIDYRQLYLTAIAALQVEIKTNERQQQEINSLKLTLTEILKNHKN